MATAKQATSKLTPEEQLFEAYMDQLIRGGLSKIADLIREKSDGKVIMLPAAELRFYHDPRFQINDESVFKFQGAFKDDFDSVPPIIAEVTEQEFKDEFSGVIPIGSYMVDEGRTRTRAALKAEVKQIRSILMVGLTERERVTISTVMNYQHGPQTLKLQELVRAAVQMLNDPEDEERPGGQGLTHEEIMAEWDHIPSTTLNRAVRYAESTVKDYRLKRAKAWVKKVAIDNSTMTPQQAFDKCWKKFHLRADTVKRFMNLGKDKPTPSNKTEYEKEQLDSLNGLPGVITSALKQAEKTFNTNVATLERVYIDDGADFDPKYAMRMFAAAEKELGELATKFLEGRKKFMNHLMLGSSAAATLESEE